MIHLRLCDYFIFYVMKIEFNIYWVYFIFSVHDKTPVKNNLGNVLELFCQFANRISRYKLLESVS